MNRNTIYALKAAVLAFLIGGAVDAHAQSLMPQPTPPTLPGADDAHRVICEQGGLQFQLGGGLLYLNPDTLAVTSLDAPALRDAWPGPVGADVPDRYEAANCSEDGGLTWVASVLDFYTPSLRDATMGYQDPLDGQASSESEEFPAGEEASVRQFFGAMVDMLAVPPAADAIGGPTVPKVPTLPTLPSPLYTIEVKYKAPGGQYLSTSVPGVFGIPTAVPIVNGNGNQPETILVQIGASQSTGTDGAVTSSGYGLKVQRIVAPNAMATCNPLEADVQVRISLANPKAPGYPSNATGSIELGYRTIGVTTKSNAPSTFDIKYESAAADSGPSRNDFFVAVTQVPSCTADAIDIVGHFVDQADPARADDDVDLTLALKQGAMTDWTLSRKTDASYRMLVTSKSQKPLGTLAVSGQNKARQISARVDAIPENVTACVHQGNLCNAAWRKDRASEISLDFKARNAADQASSLTVQYADSGENDKLDLRLSLSDLAIDSYIGRFSLKELPIPFFGGDYPKWFYFDTAGTPITGHYHTATGKHYFNIDMGGWNRIWNREVVADKKKWGTTIRVDLWGSISCSGLSISIDGVSGPIARKLLGSAICY